MVIRVNSFSQLLYSFKNALAQVIRLIDLFECSISLDLIIQSLDSTGFSFMQTRSQYSPAEFSRTGTTKRDANEALILALCWHT